MLFILKLVQHNVTLNCSVSIYFIILAWLACKHDCIFVLYKILPQINMGDEKQTKKQKTPFPRGIIQV